MATLSHDQSVLTIVVPDALHASLAPVDLRPLNNMSGIREIDVRGSHNDWRSGTAILPTSLPGLEVLRVRGETKNPEVVANFLSLKVLDFGSATPLTTLSMLERLHALEELRASAGSLAQQDRWLPDLPSLQILALDRVTQLPLSALADHHGLRSLRLYGITGDIRPLGALGDLTELRIETQSRSLRFLSRLTNLEIFAARAPLRDLSILAACPLRELHLWVSPLRTGEAGAIGMLPKLDTLTIWAPRIESLDWITSMGSLRDLQLDGCHGISDLAPVAELEALQMLSAAQLGRVRSLLPLASLGQLRRLKVTGTFPLDPREGAILARALPNCQIVPEPAYWTVGPEEIVINGVRMTISSEPRGGCSIEVDLHARSPSGEQSSALEILKGLVSLDARVEWDSEAGFITATTRDPAATLSVVSAVETLAKHGFDAD